MTEASGLYPHPACMEPDGGDGPCRGYQALVTVAGVNHQWPDRPTVEQIDAELTKWVKSDGPYPRPPWAFVSILMAEVESQRYHLSELRADADATAARIQAGDRARDDVIEECAQAAEQVERTGREWVPDSLWHRITGQAAACVRRLKTKPLN